MTFLDSCPGFGKKGSPEWGCLSHFPPESAAGGRVWVAGNDGGLVGCLDSLPAIIVPKVRGTLYLKNSRGAGGGRF
jgi:hypothetical protein